MFHYMFKKIEMSIEIMIKTKTIKWPSSFEKALNRICRNESDNNWNFKNTIDGLNRLDTPAKWIQDRVKIIT